MKKEVFDKAKSLNNSINTIKKRKERISLLRNAKPNTKPSNQPIIFGWRSTDFITLSDTEIEYFCDYLIKKSDDEIKMLEDEFEKL